MGTKTNANFRDFLYFILDRLELQGRNNEHFVPMVSLCDPCTVHYEFIGSYENLVGDSEHIFKELSIGYHFPARNDNYSATETSHILLICNLTLLAWFGSCLRTTILFLI